MWRPVLLGALATGGQVLLLRELISSFYGDEIFIGIALAGWLLWVAIGSWIGGGKLRSLSADNLFLIAGLVLPVSVVLVRIAPLWLTEHVGEAVSFIDASVVSMVMVGPVGLLCGMLFPILSQSGSNIAGTTLRVYLLEGAGAFAAGVLLTMTLGDYFSTLGIAFWLGIITILLTQTGRVRSPDLKLIIAGVAIVLLMVSLIFQDRIDQVLDAVRYRPFTVDRSFDTHYGHQTILSRQGTLSLMTDGQVELTFPDIERIENLVIPSLLYRPAAKNLLLVGRPEFGLTELCNSLGDLELTAIDPRRFDAAFGPHLSGHERVTVADPIDYMRRSDSLPEFDILILPIAGLDSYRTSRLLTTHFLREAGRRLNEGGVLAVILTLDSDRYITRDVEKLLATIYASLNAVYDQTVLWPGTSTLMLASNSPVFHISYTDLIARIESLRYQPEFIRDEYLIDRLSPIKIQRLVWAATSTTDIHSLEKPILPELARRIRSQAHPSDFFVLDALSRSSVWITILALLAVGLITSRFLDRKRGRAVGRILFVVAGYLSISLELLTFYLFQSVVGSLYTHMAMMIGSFMLGLTAGVYFSRRRTSNWLGYVSLLVLLSTCLAIRFFYDRVPVDWMTFASPLALLAVGAATGTLFVCATHLYYNNQNVEGNRGAGYGWELIGSAVSAVATIGILLPIFGMNTLLWGGACLAGASLMLTRAVR